MESIVKDEASDLDCRFAADWRRNPQRTHGGGSSIYVRVDIPHCLTGRGAVEADADCVIVGALVAKDIWTRRQIQVANFQRYLRDEEMRILAFGRISCRDDYYSSDELAMSINHS